MLEGLLCFITAILQLYLYHSIHYHQSEGRLCLSVCVLMCTVSSVSTDAVLSKLQKKIVYVNSLCNEIKSLFVPLGFADIPLGEMSPFIMRRTTVRRCSPRLAAKQTAPDGKVSNTGI